ncbi:L-proline trans-4-hydroxylase-like [Styela clava]
MEHDGTKLPIYERKPGQKFEVTESMKHEFSKNGFIIVRNLFSDEEITKLRKSLESPESELMKRSYSDSDGDGGRIRIILWNHPGDDYSGVMGRCERVVGTCEKLIGGEVFHYHTKMILKDARTGGAFQWHQDYGYWYLNGILRPDMISVQVAVDDADKGNGALQVVKGSHKMGRIDHTRIGDQAGADPKRVTEALKIMDKIYVELKAGDGLFFHCNLLHTSDKNLSDRRRWAYISCYNRADNVSYKDHFHARYTPLKKVPDSSVLECDDFNTMDGKWFHVPDQNKDFSYEYIPEKKQ